MKKTRLGSILAHKCPRCREGNMYNQNSIWPLSTMLDMPTHCKVCNQKMELETGFYFGTGYISYGMSVGILIAFFVAYHILIGLTWRDNSIFICLGSAIGFLILCQPYLMRISRVIYLSLFVPYNPNWNNNG
jgi:uncharacterized protein (DUF983 family)